MYHLIFALIIYISIYIICWKMKFKYNIPAFIANAALLISMCYIVLLNSTNDILRNELLIQKQQVLDSFSIDKLPIIAEPIVVESQETQVIQEEEIIIPPILQPIEEEPVRYDFTENDIYLMARLLCGSKYKDGDGEYDFDYGNDTRYDQISLVLCVVMNRVRDDNFPDTVEDVIMHRYKGQGYQFTAVSLWKSSNGEVSEIALQRVREWCRAYNQEPMESQSIPENYVYFSSNGKGINIARAKL